MITDGKIESQWRPITDLRTVEKNISGLGYSKEYIKANKLHRKKSPYGSNYKTGLVNFDEPLEVKEENGEFESWLGKEGYDGLLEQEREELRSFGQENYYIGGNYVDMFDCGEYSYAISNLLHLGLGWFKIVRIGKNLEAITMYDNFHLGTDRWECLEYIGRFQIDSDGECNISKLWEIHISSSNSMAVAGDFVYFGHNKMVTRLNIASGEQIYLTDKSDEELAALSPVW